MGGLLMNNFSFTGTTTNTGNTPVLLYSKTGARPTKKSTELPAYTEERLCDIVEKYKETALNYKKALGNIIAEGDLCIFFGTTNTGKSLFAYQLADAIASGKDFFDMMKQNSLMESHYITELDCYKLVNTMTKQKVLYVDFEMSKPQLALRYMSEDNQTSYQHNENIIIMKFESRAVKNKMLYVNAIEECIKKNDIRVVFIDNMSNISLKGEEADFASDLINTLADLRDKYKLTMVLIAHTFKIDQFAPKTINMLKGSSNFAILVDSVFCISRTTNENPALRYLKQFKCRYGDKEFEEDRVIKIELVISDNGNKGFIFNGYAREEAELRPIDTDKVDEFRKAVEYEMNTYNTSYTETAKRLIAQYGTKKERHH